MRSASGPKNGAKQRFDSNSMPARSVILVATGSLNTMNVLLLATAFFAIAAPPKAPVTVSVDAKNGDVISGEHQFKVTVNSQNLVTQVEFYFNDDLRDKAT